MRGPAILAQTLSVPALTRTIKPKLWQYHSRGGRHSITSCWGVLLDLLAASDLLRKHVADGTVVFGLDHGMHDYRLDRPKKLDLVVARPAEDGQAKKAISFSQLPDRYDMVLTAADRTALQSVPEPVPGPVGAVLLAVEAKACMTAHQKSYPRFYDELNSSHRAIHGASSRALAVGLGIVNTSERFVSPIRNPDFPDGVPPVFSKHRQPADALGAVDKIRQLPRRTGDADEGYDGLAVIELDCVNDGVAPVLLVDDPPVPANYRYDRMITRVANEYDVRFRNV